MATTPEPTTRVYHEIGMPSGVYQGVLDPDRAVRLASARALADARHPMVPARLAHQLAREPHGSLRELYVGILADWQHEQTATALAGVLDDDSAAVRELAARGLGENDRAGSADAIRRLRTLLGDPVEAVRCAAVTALGALGDAHTVNTLLRGLTGPDDPADVTGQPSAAERLAIIRTVAATGSDPAADRLLARVETDDPDPEVRNLAARVRELHALCGSPDAGVADKTLIILTAALADPECPARPLIATRLARHDGGPRLVAAFGRALRDRDPRLRAAALIHLSRADTPEARRFLAAGLADTRPLACDAVLAALEPCDHPDVVDALLAALAEAPPEAALYLLSLLRARFADAPPPLAARISAGIAEYFVAHLAWFDSVAGRLCMTRMLLAETCTVSSLPLLLAALTDPETGTSHRELLAKPLRELVTPRTWENHTLPVAATMPGPLGVALRDVATDGSPAGISLRDHLVYSLSQIGTPAARRPLLDLLDSAAELRFLEVSALARLGGPEFVEPFLGLLAEPERLVAPDRERCVGVILTSLTAQMKGDPRAAEAVREHRLRAGR